jgi:hypothetical protein
VRIETGRSRQKRGGFQVNTEPAPAPKKGEFTRSSGPEPKPGVAGILDREWMNAFYVEKAAFSTEHSGGDDDDVIVLIARTSPRVVAGQLFSQGIPAIGRVIRAILVRPHRDSPLVYDRSPSLILVGSIARNVNRPTRASRAIAAQTLGPRVPLARPDR